MYKILYITHSMYYINYQEILNMCKLMLNLDAVYQILRFIGDALVIISQIKLSVNLCAQMTLVVKVM